MKQKAIIPIIVCLFLLFTVKAAIDDNELIYLLVDDGAAATLTDEVSSINSTITNQEAAEFSWQSSTWKSGRAGNYNLKCTTYDLDPVEYVDTNTDLCNGNTATCTIGMWVFPDQTSSNSCLFGNGDADSYSLRMELRSTGSIRFGTNSGSTLDTWTTYDAAGFHIAVVVNTTGYCLFFNGTSTSCGTYAAAGDSLSLLACGDNIGTAGLCVNTAIDEVAIYNRSLTDAEIKDLYLQNGTYPYALGGGAPPPVAGNNTHINESRIFSETNTTVSDLEGFCNGTNDNGNDLGYYFTWYRDGSLYSTGYTSGEYCYKENATSFSDCDGLATGAYYSAEYAYGARDGDYSIGANPTGDTGYFYVNYTKPANAAYSTKWTVKSNILHNNWTIPYDCFTYHNDVIQLALQGQDTSPKHLNVTCYNGTWKLINQSVAGAAGAIIYEEAIYWSFTNTTGYTSGQEINVNNISRLELLPAANYTLSCKASNYTENSSVLDSNQADITGFITPDITINTGNFFSTNNATILSNQSATTAQLDITFTDDYDLYGYDILIYDPSNNLIYNDTNLTLSGATATVNKAIDVSSSEGLHTVRVSITDSHTDEWIEAYKVNLESNKITYDDKLSITAVDAIQASTEKQKDRYNMTFIYPKGYNKEKVYYLESEYLLEPRPHTIFEGHFVNYPAHKWVDFEGEGKATVEKITDYKYKVTTSKIGDIAKINSVGNLNNNSLEASYYLLPAPKINYTFPDSSVQWTPNGYVAVNINVTGNYQNATTFNLYLYNGTLINSTTQTYTGNGTHSYAINWTVNRSTEFKLYVNVTHKDQAGNTVTAQLNATNTLTYRTYQPPTIAVNFTMPSEFNNDTVTVNMLCLHPFAKFIDYNLTFQDVKLYTGNTTNGTQITNTTQANDSVNYAYGNCWTEYGQAEYNYTGVVYSKNFCLIDERNNSLFDVTNLTNAILYYDDNSTAWDFKLNGNTSCTNFTGIQQDKLRLMLEYADGGIVTRYIDISLFNDTSNVRLCANYEGVTHYEQLILASTERRVIMKNIYSDCIVAGDYTRFAYQDAYLLKAYTIDSMYYLYTYDDNNRQTILASVDGSIATYINIDTLEFKRDGFRTNILQQSLAFQKTGSQEVTIYYQNLEESNDDINISIKNMDTNELVFAADSDDIEDYNEFTVLFNYATLSNVTNTTLFQINVDTLNAGTWNTFKRYFTINGQSGIYAAGLGLVVAILLTIFGMTLTVSRLAFSWFGIFMLLGAIGFLSFAVQTWYITFLMAIEFILLVYSIIVMVNQNYPTVS